MNTLFNIFKIDNLNILRDKTLLMMLVLPFLLMIAVKFSLPFVVEMLPAFSSYYPLFVSALATSTGLLGGNIIAFVMLDEKDEDILSVVQVMPFAVRLFVLYRIGYAFMWSCIFTIFTFIIVDILEYSILEKILFALVCAQTSSITLLIVVIFANNKIEGMTFIKGTNFFVLIPAIAFFSSSPWTNVLAIFPQYWTYKAMQEANLTWIFVSILMHLLVFSGLYLYFLKRNRI